MWIRIVGSAASLAGIGFLMWLLADIMARLRGVAMAGQYSNDPTVQRVGGYLAQLTVNNLTLIGAVAVGIALLGGAAAEKGLG